jgi:hypothetical protein
MTFNIYNISKYSSFRDNNGEPLNSTKISGDIIKITNELKKNNKGYHLCLKNDIKYILFADIDKVTTIEEVKRILDVIALQLSIDVSKIKYSYCLKPSEDGDLYSLRVSIPCLHATLKQQHQIFLDIKNLEPNGFGKYIDVSVYQNNKLFRLPYQTLREKPIAHNKLVNAELQDFILDYIPDDSVNIGSNGFTVQGKKMYKYDKNIKFNETEEQVTIDMTTGRMKAGCDKVMKDIVTSSLFNKELNNQILRKPQHEDNKSSEGDQRSKDKGEERKRER